MWFSWNFSFSEPASGKNFIFQKLLVNNTAIVVDFTWKCNESPGGNAVLQATLFKSDESVSHFQSFLLVSGMLSMSFNSIQQKEKGKGKQNNIAHYSAMS